MNSALKTALAAAGAVALMTAACASSAQDSSSRNPSPPGTFSPSLEPTATAVPVLGTSDSVTPGRYRVDPMLPVVVTVDVPAGWGANGWVVLGPNGNQAPDGMAIRFYTAANLFLNPLAPDEGVLDPAVGPSVDDLVTAMVDHPDWTTTDPTAVSIDGYAGQVVEVTLPAGASEATPFYLFGDETGGQEWGWAAGQVFDIYVIDVGGERLVIDAFHYPGTSAEDLAAQRSVIDSVQIAP
jgi:hypothetical protein